MMMTDFEPFVPSEVEGRGSAPNVSRLRSTRTVLGCLGICLGSPLAAQTAPPPVTSAAPAESEGLSVDVTDESGDDLIIAVPALPTPQPVSTPAGGTDALGRQV